MADLKLVRNDVEAAVAADLRTNWKSLAALSRKHCVSIEFVKELQRRYDPHERNRGVVKTSQDRRSRQIVEPQATIGLMRRVYAFGVALVALLLGVVGLALNYQFAFSLGQTELASYLLGGLGVAIDAATIFLPCVFFSLIEMKRYSQSLLSVLIWLLCFGLSLIAGAGFAGSNVGDALQARDSVTQHRAILNAQASNLQMARSKITDDSSPEAIEEQIQIERGRVPFRSLASSKNCTDVTVSGAACAELNRLRALQRMAEQRIALDRDIRLLAEQIAALPPVAVKDAGAEYIGRVSAGMIEPRQVEAFRVIGFALMPSAAGFLLAFARTIAAK